MTTFIDSSRESVDQLHTMELANEGQVDNFSATSNVNFLQISCNWQITNYKQFHSGFTTAAASQEPEKTSLEDIVSLNTCISLQPTQSDNEPCMLDIKLTNNQRISRIAVVSEGYVLEFFKQFGEYETTIFAELIDSYEDNFVYLAETAIIPPATEASIKFTKTKKTNSVLWIYGIKLYLTEPINEPKHFPMDIFNPEMIKSFLSKLSLNNPENVVTKDFHPCNKNALNSSKNGSIEGTIEKESAQGSDENTPSNITEIMTYIDNRFHNMETKVMKRIDEMEQRTNQKLDIILQQLKTQFSVE